MVTDVLIVIGAYLIGSIPFAFLITKAFTGRDVRTEGEGNVGARNATFLGGRWAGILTAICDIGKGAAVYYLARQWSSSELWLWLSGAAVTLGHCYPVFLRFVGGKGLSPVTGFLLPIFPLSFLGSLVVFYIVRRVTRSFDLMLTIGIVVLVLVTYLEGRSLGHTALAGALFALTGIKDMLDSRRTARIKALNNWQDEGFQLVPPDPGTKGEN